MAELDLTDPKHLADLLEAALPGAAETAKGVAPHIEALRKSDNPAFSHVGVGERVDPHQPLASEPPPAAIDPQAAQALPLDLGGEGQALEQAEQALELAGPPVYAVRGWTEVDRHRAKGKHEVYNLRAKHTRNKPITAAFTGECQAVRVTLPRAKPPANAFVGTWIGPVEAKDHLLFSIDEVEQRYERAFKRPIALQRVDLITGARFRGRRFAPVSIYLGYRDALGQPNFYFLEGGSASGKPESLYCARNLSQTINKKAGFRFTPFACPNNWYEGGLELSQDKREPACVYLSVAQTKAGAQHYLRLSVTYDRDRRLNRVIHPFELQIEAALRVMAIAEQAGCTLRRGQGRTLTHSLGPIVRALLPWDERPKGEATPAERDQFCGCPK